METYFDAYKQTRWSVDLKLTMLAEQLKMLGCTVYAPKKGLINFIKVFKDDRHIIVGFSEVPYSWYLQYCLKPSIEHGSGKTMHTKSFDSSLYNVDDVINSMQINPQVKDFTNPTYLAKI